MLAYICLIWIGNRLNAPTWYYILIYISIFFKVFTSGMEFMKATDK